MANESEKKKVLMALENKAYEMKFVASNCIAKGMKYDGTVFYVITAKEDKPDADLGSCTVEVAGHVFTYDLNCGHWHGDDASLYEDKEIHRAIAELDRFFLYHDYDNHAQWKVYAWVNHLDENLPYYWYSEAPKDVAKLKGGSVEVPARYEYNIVPGAVKPKYRVLCDLSLADLAALYPVMQGQGIILPKEEICRVPGKWIEEVNPELYNRILNAVQKAIIEKGETIQPGKMCIALRLTSELYEEYLG